MNEAQTVAAVHFRESYTERFFEGENDIRELLAYSGEISLPPDCAKHFLRMWTPVLTDLTGIINDLCRNGLLDTFENQ